MKNYEKYKDELINSSFNSKNGEDVFCNNFVEPKILKPMGKECLDTMCSHCRVLTMVWLMDEYKEPEEPEVDWNKVPVDTKIYVKDRIDESWSKRYFAKYEDGRIFTWYYGRSSWTDDNENHFTSWDYGKLVEPEKL